MKLREIAKEYQEVAAMLTDDDEGMAVAVRDTLDAITGSFEQKALGVVSIAQNLEADCEVIDAEIARLQAIKKARIRRAEFLRDYLRTNMEATGIRKIECPLFSITLAQGREVVVIDDNASLPDDMVSVKTSIAPDKNAIAAALKAGKDVPGAHLERGQSSIRIK